MRYGVCISGDKSKIKLAKEYGYDFVESRFVLLAEASDEDFEAFAKELDANGIKAEAVNCFLPGSIKSTGNNIDYEKAREYIERGFKRGERIGLQTVVFGSGGSRQLEEGVSYEQAVRDITAFLKNVVAPLAEKYGITVVIEPLSDCNFINRVKESVIISALAESDNIKALGDLFHMVKTNDPVEELAQVKGSIYHCHIAEPEHRYYPSSTEEWDYGSFVKAMEEAGCTRCSVEADLRDFPTDAFNAIKVLRSVALCK